MKQKTALIVEGGGMRGIFTAGVLDSLLENNKEFDLCIGVSAGACHASSFLAKQYKRAYITNTKYLHLKKYCSWKNFLLTGEIFGTDFLFKEIPQKLDPIDNKSFIHGNTKFLVTVTNCKTGLAEHLPIKDFFSDSQLLRASCALPYVANIVTIDNMPYLDGGIADSIPIEKVLQTSAKKIVVVLTQPYGYRKKTSKSYLLAKLYYYKYPNLIKAIKERYINYNRSIALVEKLEKEHLIEVIRPPKKIDLGRLEKNPSKLKAAYQLGLRTAQAKIDNI